MIDLGKLKITIDTGADTAKKELNDVGETAEKQESKFAKFGGALKKGAVIGTTAVVALGGALVGTALKAADAAGELDDMAQRTGMTAEAFQQYAYAAKLSGMETETLEKAMIKSQTAFADAKGGSELMSASYQALGLDIQNIGTSSEAFDLVIERLAGMEDETQRNKIANDIFGKSYAELAPLLNSGAEGIKALKDEAVAMGAVMSNDAVAAGAEFGDSLDKVKMATTGVFNEIGVMFLPILQKLLEWVMLHMPEIKAAIETVFSVVSVVVGIAGTVFETILPILTTLYEWIVPYFPIIQSIFETTFGAIGEAVKAVTIIFEGVVGAIKTAITWLNKWDKTDAEVEKARGNASKANNFRVYSINGSNADGLANVPFDGYISELHKGERVLTANDNNNLSGKMGEVVTAVRSLENTLKQKNMNVSIGKETIGKTAIEYANEQTRMTGEFAFNL